MAQNDFGVMDPALESGTELASDLNDFRDALNSAHSGTGVPSYAVAGTIWINDASTPWVVYMHDGADDIAIGTVDAIANKFIPGVNATTVFGDIKQAATTAATGVVELATDAETQAGSPTGRAVTVGNLIARTATTSRTGIAELATGTETQTGTDPDRIVTPAGLAGFDKSHASTGYQKLPGGLILQWGTDSLLVSANSNSTKEVTFPLAFPTATLFRTAHMVGETNIASVNYWDVRAENNSASLTTFYILYINEFTSSATIGSAWFAIGY